MKAQPPGLISLLMTSLEKGREIRATNRILTEDMAVLNLSTINSFCFLFDIELRVR